MATTTNFSVRMDSDIKKQCEAMYGELGINLTTAILIETLLFQLMRLVQYTMVGDTTNLLKLIT